LGREELADVPNPAWAMQQSRAGFDGFGYGFA
jgi:hypothetical protein